MSECPTVSVCIPTYNGARYIRATIASALAQSLDDLEVIVSDDGSSDDTMDIVRSFTDPRIRVLDEGPRAGAAANWTRVVGEARGSYIKLLCQDDLLDPDCLAVQVAAIERARQDGLDPVFVSSRRRIMRDEGTILLASRGHDGLAHVVTLADAARAITRTGANVLGEPSFVLFPRDTVKRQGPFSPDWSYLIDFEYMLRALRTGDAILAPGVAGSFRLSRSSWSSRLVNRQVKETQDFVRMIAREHGDVLRPGDRLIGAVRLRVLALGRRVLYRWMRVRQGPHVS